ncbi:zinc finger protein, putative [Bodo saltans]|uniref:Zinc finger protein, putative n=1 Tax=Bodo saltans TaxID=75058 RepID=A0A0S4J892_BODSA|nr:zinc finger protein, putative [Bodo saltans]|eukprot:CUG86296.1 zinc finger protein, putative [Bodo saltans]
MSVTSSFLRAGIPCTTAKDLATTITYGDSTDLGYSEWMCCVGFARRWSEDMRHAVYYCPGAFMVFGVLAATPSSTPPPADCKGQDDCKQLDPMLLRLLYQFPLRLTCLDGYSMLDLARTVVNILGECCDAIPAARRPTKVTMVPYASHTHEAIKLFSPQMFLDRFYALLLAEDHGSAIRSCIAARDDRPVSLELQEVLGQATSWAVEQQTPSACKPVSEVPSLPAGCWPALISVLYQQPTSVPLLTSTMPLAPPPPSTHASMRHVRYDASPKRPKSWWNVTLLPTNKDEPSPPSSCWNHVVCLQPSQTMRVTSEDGIVTGPVQPCSQSLVLYLHQDVGDVSFVRKGVMEAQIPVESYDDLLPTEGAVKITVGWVEGLPFDDIDEALAALAPMLEQHNNDVSATTLTPPPPPSDMDSRSCYPWPLPHVSYRVPTGIVARRTPVENPTMQISEIRLQDQDGAPTAPTFHNVLEAFSFVMESVTQVGKTLALTVGPRWEQRTAVCAVTSPTAVACAWCGREREKLLRCGGCKAVHYCTKQHQALDWKGSHKGECQTWKKAVEAYDATVKPALNQRLASSSHLEGGRDRDSNAYTLISMLQHIPKKNDNRNRPISTAGFVLVHVVAEDLDASALTDLLASMASESDTAVSWASRLQSVAQSTWGVSQVRIVVCSRTLEAHHRNEVYRIDDGLSGVESVPSTGKMGDYWHVDDETSSSSLRPPPVALVRLFNEKYHNFLALHDAEGQGNVHTKPDVLLVLGDTAGHGMSFFSAAAEVIGDTLLGVIPVVCSDASLVAAGRTWSAILQRRTTSTGPISKITHGDVTPILNTAWCSLKETVLEGSDVKKPPVPLHQNLYISVIHTL